MTASAVEHIDSVHRYMLVIKESVNSPNSQTNTLLQAVAAADVIYMAVGVKTKEYGVGKGKAPDLSAWEHNARKLAP